MKRCQNDIEKGKSVKWFALIYIIMSSDLQKPRTIPRALESIK